MSFTCYTSSWTLVQATTATFNYGHLEAIVKADKRQYGEGCASYEDNDGFIEKEKESNFKHTELTVSLHLHWKLNLIFRGDDL